MGLVVLVFTAWLLGGLVFVVVVVGGEGRGRGKGMGGGGFAGGSSRGAEAPSLRKGVGGISGIRGFWIVGFS